MISSPLPPPLPSLTFSHIMSPLSSTTVSLITLLSSLDSSVCDFLRIASASLLWIFGWYWVGCRTNSPTLARHGDGLGYIRIWATPPKGLIFWDGAQVFRSGESCPELIRVGGWCSLPKMDTLVGPCEASQALEDLAAVLLLQVSRVGFMRWRGRTSAVLLHIRCCLSLYAVKELWSR